MVNADREAHWNERVAQWRSTGQSQRAFAEKRGYRQKRLNDRARRLGTIAGQPALQAAATF